jgi:integrase/recombinase XerD
MSKRPAYRFHQEIESRTAGFKAYLKELGNGKDTIRQKLNHAGYFLQWLESEQLQIEAVRYNDLLTFIDYCKSEDQSIKQMNRKLSSIRNFYAYLKRENPAIINPATNLFLKGTRQKVVSGIIGFQELESLYQGYPTGTPREKRNKIILGLLVYQGLTTEELHQLEPNHLKLKEGKIHIPGNRRRNSRILELRPFQILELYEYINETRPGIIKEIPTPKPARKPERLNKHKLESQLFVSINGSENIKNSLLHLFKAIRKNNPDILNPKQIRASVIINWLRSYNLRQVQYFAGHKYISSTERYQFNHLDSLQSKLEKCHPLNSLK